jgi:hypothetical protein
MAETEPFEGRALLGISDAEWAASDDTVKARLVEKELRRVADLLLAGLRPRPQWSPTDWKRLESFLGKKK